MVISEKYCIKIVKIALFWHIFRYSPNKKDPLRGLLCLGETNCIDERIDTAVDL